MPDLGNAYVNIVPRAPGISGKIEGILNEGAPGAAAAGQTFGKSLLGSLAKLGIGAAVGSLIKQGFEAGGALEQSYGGLETLYGEAADGAKAYAQAAAAAGISANDYAEQAVSFGAGLKAAFGGDTQKAMEAANTAILDMADNAAKMGTPLESIQNAYQGFAKGNYTMLDNLKLGYGGTKQEMERLLKDAQAISGVEYNIDNLGDVYDAIHVIQGSLGLTGVAASEAKTTLTGSAAAMKASWENLMAAMTTGEGMDDAMANLSVSMGAFAENVIRMLGTLAGQLPDLVLGLADVVIENAPDFIAAGAELIIQLIAGLVEKIPDIVAKIPDIWDSFKTAWEKIDWASLGTTLINLIGDGIVSLNDWIKQKFNDVMKNVFDVVGEISWSDLGKNIVNGIISGLWDGATWLYRAVRGLITNALGAGEEEAGIGSPSRLFADKIGRWIPAGVAMGAEENMAPLDKTMRSMVDGSLDSAAHYAAPAAPQTGASDADRIISALQRMQFRTEVRLEGDAREIFKVVRTTNNSMARQTSYNALGARV